MNEDHARAALAANWDPDVLAAYMAHANEDSDDSMSSDESDSDVEFEEEPSMSVASEIDVDFEHPDDIASDDSAFSSDDEFADDKALQRQAMRRELILGRPGPGILTMHLKELHNMQLAYMKELDDADVEYAEITGQVYAPIARRPVVLGLDKPVMRGDDLDAYVVDLRQRNNKEVVSTESRKQLVEEMVVLAQALFRKERVIKHLQKGL
uniref:Uncharacterized protein n=1 Tax=Mycena chlorophos TaxID=658473 RepID=A0ABQ0KZQ3_MYCCL|nr:predicted protein [Mycena chlorophos]